MPKVLCCGCRTRLANLDTGKLALEKFENDRRALEILSIIGEQQYSTRSIVGYKEDSRCHVCQINGTCLNNFIIKLNNHGPRPGRPLEQSPCKEMCSNCGRYLEIHDDKFCRNITKHPKSSFEAGKLFAERVEARGFTSKVEAGYIKHALEQERNTQPDSYKPLVGLNQGFISAYATRLEARIFEKIFF